MSLSITRRASQAEDAVQEAFRRLWTWKANPKGDAVAYVFRTVRNVAIEQTRRRRPVQGEQDSPESIYDGRSADPASAAMRTEHIDAACRAPQGFSDEQRQAVVMRIYGGLKFAQIAEALGQREATVISRYHRAMEKLRIRLSTNNE